MKEKFETFDFEMSEEEIKEIDGLNGKDKRIQDDEEKLEKEHKSAPAPNDN